MVSSYQKKDAATDPRLPRVVLHVGMPKTATSSFYTFLRAHRHELHGRGILYPRLRTKRGKPLKPNDAAWLLSSGLAAERASACAAIHAELQQARGLDVFFLGAENITRYARADDGESHVQGARRTARLMHAGDDDFWARRETYLSDLAEVFASHSVELWIALRRRDRFAESIYRQVLLNRRYVGTISELAFSPFALLDYERIIRQYAQFFPVRLFIYEDLIAQGDGNAVIPLARELGVGDLAEGKGADYRVNTKYSPEVLEYIRRLNHFPVAQKKDVVRRLVEWSGREGGSFANTSLLSAEERRDLVVRYSDSDRRIMESFPLNFERAELFPMQDLDAGRQDEKKYEGMASDRFRYICGKVCPEIIGAV